MTAARIIAPIIGSSIYTWTSVIGVILLGLAFGNYTGGLIIDKKPEENILSKILFISAIFVTTIPVVSRLVIPVTFWDINLLLRILLMSFFLFVLPSFSLGTIYPASMRLFINNLDKTGEKSGLLSAISALGGITGTFLTGFIFIGFLGSSLSIYLMALVLLINSYLFGASIKKVSATIILIILISLIWIFYQRPNNSIFEKESNYYKIKIVDKFFNNRPARLIFLDFDSHSVESLDNKKIGTYQEISSLFQIFKKDFKNILVLGGGSYNMPKDMKKLYGADVTVVEIDPVVTQMAKKFFNLDSYKIKTVNEDGRLYLNVSQEKFDLIMQDAFNSFISMPWHLATIETFQSAKKRLNYGGIYSLSIISSKEGNQSNTYKSIAKTFAKVFPNYHAFYLNSSEEKLQNIFLIGINSDENFDAKMMNKKISKLIEENGIPLKVSYAQKPDIPEDVPYLSDDFAPVEKLSLISVNEYINNYAKWYYTNK